jgi:hypothetical protein
MDRFRPVLRGKSFHPSAEDEGRGWVDLENPQVIRDPEEKH